MALIYFCIVFISFKNQDLQIIKNFVINVASRRGKRRRFCIFLMFYNQAEPITSGLLSPLIKLLLTMYLLRGPKLNNFKKLINIQQSLCPIRCSGFVTRKTFYTT